MEGNHVQMQIRERITAQAVTFAVIVAAALTLEVVFRFAEPAGWFTLICGIFIPACGILPALVLTLFRGRRVLRDLRCMLAGPIGVSFAWYVLQQLQPREPGADYSLDLLIFLYAPWVSAIYTAVFLGCAAFIEHLVHRRARAKLLHNSASHGS